MMTFRLAGFYATAFGVIGISTPFWPLWLKSRGLGPEDIGLAMALGIVVKIFANPMIAVVADRHGERKRLMIALLLVATLVFSLFYWAHDFWSIVIVILVFQALWSPALPLMETLTMQTKKIEPLNYGRIRLWGSVTFIIGAWGMGELLSKGSVGLVYWVTLGALILTFLSTLTLPDTRIAKPAGKKRPIRDVLSDRTFVTFVVATALIQSSHGVYYTFGTIHWQSVGHSEAIIGWLWAEGVIAEVLLFMWGDRIVKRFGATRLIALAGIAGLIRWALTGVTDALPALMTLQLFHALTFGAAHLGAIHFIARRMAPSVSATAQGIYAATVMGLAMGVSAWVSGKLYGGFGSQAYYLMAVMAGLGGIIAYALRQRS